MEKSSKIQNILTLKDCHQETIWGLNWSCNGQLLASCSSDKSINLYRLDSSDTGNKLTLLDNLQSGHQRSIRQIEFSPSGQSLASASFDSTVGIWSKQKDDNNSDSFRYDFDGSLQGHENEVKCVSFSRVAPLLATCSRDKSIWIWEYGINDYSGQEEDFECVAILQEHSGDVKFVKWHPTSEVLFSCSYDNTIRIWIEDGDGDDWYCAQTLNVHTDTVWALDFNVDGSKMVSVSADRSIIIWEFNGRECVPSQVITDSHSAPIYSVSWNDETNQIATAGGDDAINIYYPDDSCQYELYENFQDAHEGDVNCVRWNPTHKNLLVTCSDDCSIKLWQINGTYDKQLN